MILPTSTCLPTSHSLKYRVNLHCHWATRPLSDCGLPLWLQVGKVVQVTRTLEDIEVVERWGHISRQTF